MDPSPSSAAADSRGPLDDSLKPLAHLVTLANDGDAGHIVSPDRCADAEPGEPREPLVMVGHAVEVVESEQCPWVLGPPPPGTEKHGHIALSRTFTESPARCLDAACEPPFVGNEQQPLVLAPHADEPAMKRKRLGPAKITRFISKGSYGRVYEARLEGQRVAVKVQPKDGDTALQTVSQKRQLAILRRFSGSKHPNVASLVAWRETAFDVQLILQFCETDLRTHISSSHPKGLPSHDAKRLSRDMCSGLKYIHQKSVLHRDLKSSNVLLQMADGQPLAALIADFGEARLAVGSPLTPDVVTIWYRAPEILVSHDRYGSHVDVWSLGCTIVEMEHGMPPFVAASEVGMLFVQFYTFAGHHRVVNGSRCTPHPNRFRVSWGARWWVHSKSSFRNRGAMHMASSCDASFRHYCNLLQRRGHLPQRLCCIVG